MVTENIQISIRETGGRRVVSILNKMDSAGRRASESIDKLKKALRGVNVGQLTKLIGVQAKLLKASADKLKAQNVANRQQAVSTKLTQQQILVDERAAINKQKLAQETSKTAVAANKEALSLQNLRKAEIQTTAAGVRLEQQQRRVARSMNVTRKSGGLLRSGTLALASAFAFIGVLRVASTFVELSNVYTNLQNRLKLVTTGSENLGEVTEKLQLIADRTRSSFASTGELYARVALSTKTLGLTQARTLQFTKSLNQAIILSGASAAEASNGVIQLAQGLASNRLSGDELRSVLEQLPLVADTIAKGLGVTRGELRKMGAEGKISAQAVIDAFAKAEKFLDQEFAKTVSTIAQGWVVFLNGLTKAIGEFDKTTGAAASLAKIFIFLGKNLIVVGKATIFATGAFIAYKASLSVGAFSTILRSLRRMEKRILLQGIAWGATATRANAAILSQVTMLGRLRLAIRGVTFAMLRFTGAIFLNPFILLTIAITTLLGVFAVFRDQLKASENGLITVGDLMRKAGEAVVFLVKNIGDFVGIDTTGLKAEIKSVFEFLAKQIIPFVIFINKRFDDFKSGIRIIRNLFVFVFTEILNTTKRIIASIITFFKDAIKKFIIEFKTEIRTILAIVDKTSGKNLSKPFNKLVKEIETANEKLAKLKKLMEGFTSVQQFNETIKILGGDPDKPLTFSERFDAAIGKGVTTENVDKVKKLIAAFEEELKGGVAIKKVGKDTAEKFNDAFLRGMKDGLGKVLFEFQNISKQIETLMVNTFNRMADALTAFVITGKFNFKTFADSVIKDIVRIIIKQQLARILNFAGVVPVGPATAGLQDPAPPVIGSRNELADGGLIGGTGGPRADDKLIAASSGEFVINAASTKRFLPLLRAINNNKSSGAASSTPSPRSATAGGGGGGALVFAPVLNITVDGVESEQEGQEQAQRLGKVLEKALEQKFAQFIRMQQRNGGMLNTQQQF